MTKYMHKHKSPVLGEKGFASVVIALTMVIVIALLTIGFAQLARREQQNSLNKQLSRQAYYAAETGVNDMVTLLKNHAVGVGDTGGDCLMGFPFTVGSKSYDQTISTTNGVSYSCVTISTKNYELVKKPIAQDTGWTTIFSNPGLSPLSSFDITWESTVAGKALRTSNSGFAPASATPTLPAPTIWVSPAVLQVSITPLVVTDRTSLYNNTFTTYLYPATWAAAGTANVAYNKSGGVAIVNGCTSGANYTCNVTIRCLEIATGALGCGAPGGVPGAQFLVHILPYYDTSNITLNHALSQSSSSVTFDDAQAVIDVTGKAREVLKRIQVRVPLTATNANDMPNYGIEAQDICKRIKTDPVTTNFIGVNDSTSNAGAGNGPSCILSP